ncbi:hypothetical protein A6V36_01825 [Paraburkholderia ginsengiterrae]|uniref:Uncharacterized protein n=1 Tax=Paraburkholderia ginsengiterrae TaxID=1462993 RepID=A0A1A9NCH9_9BURK|nr:hypothetical protein [Paraburkholderia ginsengiterrae]OAJ60557.1 hypothetical protein A6V36_01825 [Paraburkholderia ginsengiterrae]OAJ64110.1 hypothetical protein A6V37_01020 [Paraburkholderia ginsengiterrae]
MEEKPPETLDTCDLLRAIDSLYEPDVRNGFFSRRDADTGEIRPDSVSEHLADVAAFSLSTTVPRSIQVHFETAKNLYAYAWFVYRFFPVAEQQALTSLEFALRERLAAEVAQSSRVGVRHPRGLKNLLKEARDRGLVSNDRFSWAEERALQRARQRAELQEIQEMQRLGLTTIEVNYSNVKPLPEDFDHDWIGTFIDTLPRIRNTYAHGSGTLHNAVLRTFEIVSELTNQLFAPAR